MNIDTNKFNEVELSALGARLAESLGIAPDSRCNPPRYMLGQGYRDKTALGLARVVLAHIEEAYLSPQ